jgi:hypothetical protein
MKIRKTEVFSARVTPGTADRVREMREQLAEMYPGYRVTVADVLEIAVSSASAAFAAGTLPGLPPRPANEGP